MLLKRNLASMSFLALPPDVIPAASCPAFRCCGSACPVWRELTTNHAYQLTEGFDFQTMTGWRENLRFRSQQQDGAKVIRVWRVVGNLDFSFDESSCQAICQCFAEGLQDGHNFVDGGAAYFTHPSWANPPLGRITTPFAAAVVRHARQCIGLPI